MQVGERERKELLERVEREVLDLVSARLVDPTTKRVYTTGMIGKALDQLSAASGQQQGGKAKGGAGGATGETPASDNTTPSKSETGTPVPPVSLEDASQPRKPLWTGVVATKSAKNQALDAMKALIAWQPIPVMRARMQLRITCPTSVLKHAVKSTHTSGGDSAGAHKGGNKGKGKKGKKGDDSDEEARGGHDASAGTGTVKDRILSYFEQVESQQVVGADEWEVTGFAEPGAFKGLSDFVGGETKGRGRVEVLEMAVTHEE